MHRAPGSQRAFSLVEVAVALGVAALALVGLFTVLQAGAEANRAAEDQALVAQMAERVLAEIRGEPFAELSRHGAVNRMWWFDAEGQQCNQQTALYECQVAVTPEESSRPYPQGPLNLVRLRLEVSWPMAAPTSERKRQTIYSSAARF